METFMWLWLEIVDVFMDFWSLGFHHFSASVEQVFLCKALSFCFFQGLSLLEKSIDYRKGHTALTIRENSLLSLSACSM